MKKKLAVLLGVSGVTALIAIAFPFLVFIGFFMFIIPGLVLFLAPTVFMYLVLYAGAWAALYLVNRRAAPWLAVPIVALIGWAAVQPSQIAASATIDRYALADVARGQPVRLSGNIRIDAALPDWDNANAKRFENGFRPQKCGDLCLALLFQPGVTSVTMNVAPLPAFAELRDGASPLDRIARTYRLTPNGQCGDDALEIESISTQHGKTVRDNRAIAAEWTARLSSDVCLTGTQPLRKHDFVLRAGEWRSPGINEADKNTWADPAGLASAHFAEIRDGSGQVLFRKTKLAARSLSTPLHVQLHGSIENARFGWGWHNLPDPLDNTWESPHRWLDAAIVLKRTGDTSRALETARSTLAAAVADAAVAADAPPFKLMRNYFDLLDQQGIASEKDYALLAALIGDRRLDDIDGIWVATKVFSAEQQRALIPAIVAKLATPPPGAQPGSTGLGMVLKDFPPGSFADPDAATLALLANPSLRRRANGLIRRLSDMGEAGAPLLAGIVGEQLRAVEGFDRDDPALTLGERDGGYNAHRETFGAAVSGLCRLGPRARGVLPRLLAIDARYDRDGSSRRAWDRMMVRVGKPIDGIDKPVNMSGSVINYRNNLREFLARYDDRDTCDW